MPARTVPATQAHVDYISTRLRPLDLTELAAYHSMAESEVPAMLATTWQQHHHVQALVRDGEPLCIFGAMPISDPDMHVGFIWMVGTERITARELMRFGKKAVADLQAEYPTLFCLVLDKHHISLRWLRHLGFTRSILWPVNEHTFVMMVKEGDC